jgi:chromosome segregation ATPase
MRSREQDGYERIAATLKKLKKGNVALEKECEDLTAELAALNAQKSLLEARLQELNAKREAEKIADIEERELQERIEELEEEHERAMERLADMKRVFEQTVVELCKERKKRISLETKTARIIENIRALTKVGESLRVKPEQVKQNEVLAKRLEDKRITWRQSKSELQALIHDLQMKRDAILEDARNYQIQIDDRAGLIEELEAKVDRRNQTIADLERDLQAHVDEKQCLLGDLDGLKKEVEFLSRKSQTVKDNLKKTLSIVASNKKKCAKETEKVQVTKSRLQQLQLSFAEKLRVMKEESEQETKTKLEELQKLVGQRDDEIQRLQEEAKAAKEQCDAAAAKLKKLEIERAAEQRKFAQAKENYENGLQNMQKMMMTWSQPPL